MPETHAQLEADGLTVTCPRWREIPGLLHGVTTRQALPQPGKNEFFKVIHAARAARAFPFALTIGADQVHGDHLETIVEPFEYRQPPAGLRRDEDHIYEFAATDALVTTLPGVLLVIQTADCLPVFMVDPAARLVGLAHCGWRGLRAGLAGKLASEMVVQGAAPDTLEAWLGPAICTEHYEVGGGLVKDFEGAFPGAACSPDGTHLDLAAVARWQLEQAGVDPARICESGECTLGQMDRYHSYRGEKEKAGRLLSFIGFIEG
jgi:YfiH family protein